MSLNARSIARALAGDVLGKGALVPGPGHGKDDRSLRIFIDPNDPDGFRAHSYAGDDWRDCRDHVKDKLGIDRDAWRDRDQGAKPEPAKFDLTPDPAKALRLWAEGVDPRGTPVETYLRSRRLELDDAVCGEVLRAHEGVGAMLALFRNIQTNDPQAISRTYITGDGRKDVARAPGGRMFLGPAKGAAIKLDADEDVLGGLHIGEGIETCMTARMFGLRPTWALGSAGAIANFPVLSGIESMTIFREPGKAGVREAEKCARRWHDAGREVQFFETGAGDLNDAAQSLAQRESA